MLDCVLDVVFLLFAVIAELYLEVDSSLFDSGAPVAQLL